MPKLKYDNEDFMKFLPYLRELGLNTEVMLERIYLLYELCSNICPEKIEDIFIEDYIKEDGTREYTDLDFNSKNYGLSARNFLSKIDYSITFITNRVEYFAVQTQDYDLNKATDKSRMNVEVIFEQFTSHFKAAKNNCDYLSKLIEKYIKPNLKSSV